jgi:protein-tyrosine-phosphatase
MAEALVNHLAVERQLPIRAVSGGTIAGERINPVAVQAMQEIGILIHDQKPKQLTAGMVYYADRTITMGCGVDASACLIEEWNKDEWADWGLGDPADQPIEVVREIRDRIRDFVEVLLTEMITTDENEEHIWDSKPPGSWT